MLFSLPLPHPRPGVMYQSLDDGAVLLAPAAEIYFGLNHVGARVWELLPPALHQFDEMCARVCAAYPDADPMQVRADVVALLRQLEDAGLVDPVAGDDAAPHEAPTRA